jgi:hypothetical protein
MGKLQRNAGETGMTWRDLACTILVQSVFCSHHLNRILYLPAVLHVAPAELAVALWVLTCHAVDCHASGSNDLSRRYSMVCTRHHQQVGAVTMPLLLPLLRLLTVLLVLLVLPGMALTYRAGCGIGRVPGYELGTTSNSSRPLSAAAVWAVHAAQSCSTPHLPSDC